MDLAGHRCDGYTEISIRRAISRIGSGRAPFFLVSRDVRLKTSVGKVSIWPCFSLFTGDRQVGRFVGVLALVLACLSSALSTTSPVVLTSGLTAAPPKEFSSWKKWKREIDRTLNDLRRTSQVTVQHALLEHLSDLVRSPVKPRKRYLSEVEALLNKTPPGALFNSMITTLMERPSQGSVAILFRALGATRVVDYFDRELPHEQLENRARTIEVTLRDLGDRAYRKRLRGSKPKLSKKTQVMLQAALASSSERQVRGAAYLLGGWGRLEAAPALRAAIANTKEPWTRAILVENLGRTDVSGAEAEIMASASGSRLYERLAAIPLLGHVKTAAAQKKIESFLDDKLWYVRRAALIACRHRRDAIGMDFLLKRFPKETPRLRVEIFAALTDLTGGVMPPDPKEWAKWWSYARKDFNPAKPRAAGAKSGKTELVLDTLSYFGLEIHSDGLALLVDVSGSMVRRQVEFVSDPKKEKKIKGKASPFHVANEEIRGVLKQYPKGARFNLIAFNDRVLPFQKKLVKKSARSAQKALRFLKKLKPEGETNTYDALKLALTDVRVDTIVLVSDGEPTRGRRTETADILEAIARVNRFRGTVIHTVQIGEEQPFMRRLASGNGGSYKVLPLAAVPTEAPP